ncbi:MAG: dsDNA nuclease domain-containing protein [Paludibaculum sp.]
MITDPAQIAPSDDSGSETFERFCYQAHIAFPYCLNCALGGDVVSVVAEHIEDVAVEFQNSWRFLQIKTRDLEKGPWRFSDVAGKGGGLHSLHRTYKAVKHAEAILELHLEGVIHRNDPLHRLQPHEDHCDPSLVSAVRNALKMEEGDCHDFLQRVRVIHSHPTRATIQAQNLRLLVHQAGHLPASVLDDIYERMLSLTYKAMQARLLPVKWHSTFLTGGRLKGKAQELFAQKRLTKGHLATIVAPLTAAPRPLLKRLTEGQLPMTALEQKLVIGGASPDLIEDAKTLRANASRIEFEIAASAMYDEAVLEDVHNRLLMRAHGLVNQYGTGKTPAAAIWNNLLHLLGQQCQTIDSRGLFHRDPDLLLGAICDLSDKCRTGWGTADA